MFVRGLAGLMLLCATPVLGQTPSLAAAFPEGGSTVRMTTLLEKTIFKVDVLTLEVRFAEPVADSLRRLAAAGDSDAVRERVATVALTARDVWARMTFHRNVKLRQFLDGLEDSARSARDAGIVEETTYQMVVREGQTWYAALADRNIRDGDEMVYRIVGDTLRTVVRGVEGTVWVDQTDVGTHHVMAVLGGYFAPRSDFRRGLIESLLPETR